MNKNDELKQLVDDVVGVQHMKINVEKIRQCIKVEKIRQCIKEQAKKDYQPEEEFAKYFGDDLGNPIKTEPIEFSNIQPWEELSKVPPHQDYILRYSQTQMDFVVCRWMVVLSYYQDIASFTQRLDAEEYIQF